MEKSRIHRVAFTRCAVIASALLLALPVAAFPEFHSYQVPFSYPQTKAVEAIASLPLRRDVVVNWLACAEEIDFLAEDGARVNDEGSKDHHKRRGASLAVILAKIAWLADTTPATTQTCTGKLRVYAQEVKEWQKWPNTDNKSHVDPLIGGWGDDAGLEDAARERRALINAAFERRFTSACGDVLKRVDKVTLPDDTVAYDLTFGVRSSCMRQQVNLALNVLEPIGNIGTSKLPCRVTDSGEGDWDMAVIGLLRILAIDARAPSPALTSATRNQVISKLLTISGDLEPESYGLLQCGNTEHDTGSPQERADERAFYTDGFFDDLGDLFSWFLKFLILAVAVAAALPLLYSSPVGPVLSAVLLAGAGAATVVISEFRIPETENHLLMINSSRFLTNQLIIDSLPDQDDRQRYENDQEEIREWLLQRLSRITNQDFIEYNSKPYHRLSIAAILNLYDFADPAEEQKLRTASQIVLDFAFAKFAAGSNLNRRIVPFRRLMEVNRFEIFGPSDAVLAPRRLFELSAGSDHLIAAMLFYTGQTQHLPKKSQLMGYASRMSLGQMMPEVTSDYTPHELILDLAMNKSTPYEQRIHHDGFEIYSSGKGYLISAGGIATDYAYGGLLTPLSIPTDIPFNLFLKNEDRGSGVPTVLMPASDTMAVRRDDFLRIEGAMYQFSHADRDEDKASDLQCVQDYGLGVRGFCARNITNDFNLCVRKGFACGTSIRVPAILELCLRSAPNGPSQWRFIDSASCVAYEGAPPFYVALFREPCPPDMDYCKGEWGFFEAVDKPEGVTFTQFMEATIQQNPSVVLPPQGALEAKYTTWRGDDLVFKALGHDEDSDSTGIISVNNVDQGFVAGLGDIDDWPLAAGDAITANGEGRMAIRSPAAPGRRIEIDFTDWENPQRQVLP